MTLLLNRINSSILTDFIKRSIVFVLLSVVSAYAMAYENEAEIMFETNNGEKIGAYEGWISVPENRQKPNSRTIKVNYVRFPATSSAARAASPIIYLSGGPGGSGIGTAKGERFPLFMAMREFGDVIALDQRGLDEGLLRCESGQKIPYDKAITDARYTELHKLALQECLAQWESEGVDIRGYTTQESAYDLDDLRQHFNAKKLTLWGISYGSHLALAALKVMEGRIDRVVLSSVEGLDQTIKMPSRTNDYFDRLQQAINKDDSLREAYPNLKQLIRDVHAQLEETPLALELTKDEKAIPVVFQKRDIQLIASGLIADPQRALMLLDLYKGIQAGETGFLVQLLSQHTDPRRSISFYGMSVAMDIASGITQARYEKVLDQVEVGLLEDRLNFGLDHFGDIPGIDLGDSFRQAPNSDVPVLILSGTLDGRTYIESQEEAVRGLSNATLITVENAGHNLFMSSPKVTQVIQQFMAKKAISRTHIKVDLAK